MESTESRKRGRPRGWVDTSEQTRIKALDRAMMVLETLSLEGAMTLTELAQACEQSPATVYRVLTTLAHRDIVDFEADQQTWHIGAGAFRIGSRFLRRTALVENARPALRALMLATGETANLAVARNGQVLFLSQVETHETIRAFFPPGTMSPMHASGIGKALLAQMPTEQVRDILDAHGQERFTRHTLPNPDSLLADLALAKRRGYAVDDEEKSVGMRCVAAPIFDMHGEAVAGISVSGPSARVSQSTIAGIANHVIAAARDITHRIGGPT
ncbi:HTH-type transcriptional regulator BhcR [Cognatishimia sp. F0-27]|uniref:HTH-type transcriptional regulator BhcR n=1 Tax=Cognatishimia sp. F0-27 TaxID=2816855 RepID=UPI001D0C5435|nr:HTH-type transcriptional regulator BhcR [Cognatishimia sp. F0-27]MCC1494806.1 IclR family transcriptional regulator [Cognatishimia sp. F0-27]